MTFISNSHAISLVCDLTHILLSQDSQDFIDNTQTHKCVTWGHNIYTVLHGEMIIYYQKH